jgi:hypothetical protein
MRHVKEGTQERSWWYEQTNCDGVPNYTLSQIIRLNLKPILHFKDVFCDEIWLAPYELLAQTQLRVK